MQGVRELGGEPGIRDLYVAGQLSKQFESFDCVISYFYKPFIGTYVLFADAIIGNFHP